MIFAGLAIAGLGVVLFLAAKVGLKPFRLPGDIVWKPSENSTIYLPITTSILLSILLSLAGLLLRSR